MYLRTALPLIVLPFGFLATPLVTILVLAAQTSPTPQPLTSEEIISRVSPSVALILAGKGDSQPASIGTGIIVQADGVLLTAHHVVKDANAVQVRLRDGEIFDRVELLDVDPRRDVAALRITAQGLPALPIARAETVKPGQTVYVVSHPVALPWTAASGILSAMRLADEVLGAGSGYRLLQFTASVSPGSSGGLLVNEKGEALGLILGSLAGQNLNFAVPLESVLGLTATRPGKPYLSGSALTLPEAPKPKPALTQAQAPAGQLETKTPAPVTAAPVSRNPSDIVRSSKTIYILAKEGGTLSGFPSEPLKKKLLENKDFSKLNLVIVNSSAGADILIKLDRIKVSWDCTYDMTHPATDTVLGAGKEIAWDCVRAAPGIANQIVNRLKQLSEGPAPSKETPGKQPKP